VVAVKVQTVGDAYTCASGVPIRNPNHAAELADMALAIRLAVAEFKVRYVNLVEVSETALILASVWRTVGLTECFDILDMVNYVLDGSPRCVTVTEADQSW